MLPLHAVDVHGVTPNELPLGEILESEIWILLRKVASCSLLRKKKETSEALNVC